LLLVFREFEDVEQEEQDIVPEEPEVRISREEVIARYQVCKRPFQNKLSFLISPGC
jgi:hypothetical protein